MESASSWEYAGILTALIERRELTALEVEQVLGDLIEGRLAEPEAAGLLVALRMKGETAGELAAGAAVLRRHMVPLPVRLDGALDTCGTGGDGTGTFNISTAVALVTAAAGVPVVKHGSRAMSSRSGSADVLASLGVPVEAGTVWAGRCLRDIGLAFCLAPHFHPALARLAPVRRRLGVRTIFNCLGPLANPGAAPYQLLGVGRRELLDPLAGAQALLGTRHTLVVWGEDGLDEVSLAGPTHVRQVRQGTVASLVWTPRDFGLEPCSQADLQASGAAESAAIIRGVLAGQPGPARRIVLANAAAALLAAERVSALEEGVARAAAAVDSGKAREVLDRLVQSAG